MKQRLVEKASFDLGAARLIESTEALSNKLEESIQMIHLKEAGIQFTIPATRSIWEVPISRINTLDKPNANGRVYGLPLWENVINNQRNIWEGSAMLLDHPEGDSEGSTTRIGGVWLDARIDESTGIVWGTLIFTEAGKNIEDAISLGYRCGTSSSGFGELLEDGKTVNPKTFEIERLSDAVLNPSQGTYFSIANQLKNKSSKVEDAGSSSSYRFERNILESESGKMGSIIDPPSSKLKEKTMAKFNKIEERRVRSEMEQFLKETESKKDPQVRLQDMNDMLEYLKENENVPEDIKTKVEEKIISEKDNIKNLLSEAIKIKEEFSVQDSEKLKQGVALLAEEVRVVEAESKDWQEVAKVLKKKVEELSAVLAARPTSKYVETIINKFKKEQEKFNKTIKQKNILIESKSDKIKEQDNIIDKMNSEIVEIQENLEEATQIVSSITEQKEKFRERISTLKSEIAVLKEEHEKEISSIHESYKPKLTRPLDRVAEAVNFKDHSSEVQLFWEDVLERHGKSIRQFKNLILEAGSVREAKSIYQYDVLPNIESLKPLSESNSVTREERKHLLESQGMNFGEEEGIISKTLSKLKGWN